MKAHQRIVRERKEIEDALNYRQNSFEEKLRPLLPTENRDIDYWKRISRYYGYPFCSYFLCVA